VRVHTVVVTYNRKHLLLQCLAALERQTHPVERVIVVDNASTDGTQQALEESGLDVDYLPLRRNGGGAEGFHYGVREALRRESDWLWLMDDDCEPADDALERLLASAAATRDDAAALVPAVRTADDRPLPLHRGRIVSRLVRAPIQALSEQEYAQPETECDFASFVGPLFRTSAVRSAGLPLREAFLRFEDLEYAARLRPFGRMWLVRDSVVVHKEAAPLTGADLASLWKDFSRRVAFKDQWKSLYGLRNTIFAGRRHGFVTGPAALSYVLMHVVGATLFDERKARMLRLIGVYALDGWRGTFRNVPPPKWPGLGETRRPLEYLRAESLRYDAEVAEPVRRLATAAAPPTPAA
jgi:rhamnopyranosyl-N-acetylglucosaminyl-diphospho-decaprenol beta-1,3/1,4-galactofuranosyltransferase